MDGNKDEHSMVTQIAQTWAPRIVGPLVVATILGLVASGIGMWNSVNELRAEVVFLKKEMEKGGRFTKLEGKWHNTRINKLEESVTRHHQSDEGHSGIRRNTPIILDNQTKAHTHLFLKGGNRNDRD